MALPVAEFHGVGTSFPGFSRRMSTSMTYMLPRKTTNDNSIKHSFLRHDPSVTASVFHGYHCDDHMYELREAN